MNVGTFKKIIRIKIITFLMAAWIHILMDRFMNLVNFDHCGHESKQTAKAVDLF